MSWQICQFEQVYTKFYEEDCDKELQAEIDSRLDILRDLGNTAREPYSKPVEDGIFECRANTNRHQARLLFCFQPGKRIVIVVAVMKAKRKLERSDIETAKKRKAIIEAEQEIISGLHKTH
jgi:hypothetical protein